MKFKLQPDPTFTKKVGVPVHGQGTIDVSFTFKHRTREEFNEFTASSKDIEDVDYILAVATGWDLEQEFNRENINTLVQNYMGAPGAIAVTYTQEILGSGSRLKN